MDATQIAARLTPAMFPGPYADTSDAYADLKRALVQAAPPGATVHVQRQDPHAIRSVRAFTRVWRPDGAITTEGRRIGVEVRLLRKDREAAAITGAIGRAMVLSLHYDEALLVFLASDYRPQFTLKEKALLHELWRAYRTAWVAVPVERTAAVAS